MTDFEKTVIQAIKDGEVRFSLDIDFYCNIDQSLYDLGALTLEKDGRKLVLDAVSSSFDEVRYALSIELKVMEEMQCDLKVGDLYSLEKPTFYLGGDYEIEPEHITMFVVSNGSTRAINVDLEN